MTARSFDGVGEKFNMIEPRKCYLKMVVDKMEVAFLNVHSGVVMNKNINLKKLSVYKRN